MVDLMINKIAGCKTLLPLPCRKFSFLLYVLLQSCRHKCVGNMDNSEKLSFEKCLSSSAHLLFCGVVFVWLFLGRCLTQVKHFFCCFFLLSFLKSVLTGQCRGFLYREIFWCHRAHVRYEGTFLFTGNLPFQYSIFLHLMSLPPHTIP